MNKKKKQNWEKEFDKGINKILQEEFDKIFHETGKELKAQNKELREKIEGLDKVKFPRGERKWCIECAKRIKKYLMKQNSSFLEGENERIIWITVKGYRF